MKKHEGDGFRKGMRRNKEAKKVMKRLVERGSSASTWRTRSRLWRATQEVAKRKGLELGPAAARVLASLRVKNSTAVKYASHLRTMLRWKGVTDMVELELVVAALRKKLGLGKKAKPATKECMQGLLRWDGQEKPEEEGFRWLVWLAWTACARLGETCRLKKGMVQLRRGRRKGELTVDWGKITKAGNSMLWREDRVCVLPLSLSHPLFSLSPPPHWKGSKRLVQGKRKRAYGKLRRWMKRVPSLQGLSGHSFRRGGLQHRHKRGESLRRLMQIARHKKVETLLKYIREE